jgi:DNA-binding response OmpR family regulator
MDVRSMLLRYAGHCVEEAYSTGDAIKALQSGDTEIVLICHSMTASEHDSLIAAVHQMRGKVPVICLVARPGDTYNRCLNVITAPAALLEAISELASAA